MKTCYSWRWSWFRAGGNGQEPRMGRELRLFEGHTSDIQAVSISPDGRFAFSGSNDTTSA
jgi:WD40 repeat protein